MHELRTIDVWDTLLRRDCHPECIKLATARYLQLKYSSQLKVGRQDPWALYHARIDAERFLADASRQRGCDDEYEITDVLRQWLNLVWQGPFDQKFPEALAEYELGTEISRTYCDPEIMKFLEIYPAKQTMFLSDFYMNSKMLGRLIEVHQLKKLVPSGVSSCDVGLNKRSGNLFSYIQSNLNVSVDKHVHIGDNEWSDVTSPGKLGIKAVRYLPMAENSKRLVNEHLFSSRNVLFEHVHALCRDEVPHFSVKEKKDEEFLLGVEAAPLFIGFSVWIAEQAVKNKLEKIIFLTREGEFFHEIFSGIYSDGVFAGINLPEIHVFPVSRVSTFVASLETPDINDVSRAWSLFGVQRISALFTALGLNVGNFLTTLKAVGLEVDEVVENPSSDQRMKALFSDAAFCESLQLSIANSKQLLKDLLFEHGIHDGMKVGVVDIGWRGTIQDNIALSFPEIDFHGMYLGLRSFVNAQPENVVKNAYGPDENVGEELNRLFEVFLALEMVCSSPNGSVVGYQREGGRVVAVREVSSDENVAYFDFSRKFQNGVAFAAKNWAPFLNSYVVSSSEIRDRAIKVWDGFRRSPPDVLASVFIKTPQHDVFGFGEMFSKENFPSLLTIFLSPFLKAKRRETLSFVRRVQWTAAVNKASDLGWFHRKILSFVFLLANHLKILRMKIRHNKRKFF